MENHLLGKLDFGQALDAMKRGHRVAREGWNGKQMWVAITPGSVIPLALARNGAANLRACEVERDSYGTVTEMRICAHIDMRAADGSLVIGWAPSQTDLLAEDWMILQ